MTNQDYILNWLQNYNQRYKNGNLYSDANTLYSYGNFIIGLKVEDCILYTTSYASPTTSCHLGLLRKNLESLQTIAFPCAHLKQLKDEKTIQKQNLIGPVLTEVHRAANIKPNLWKNRPYYKEDFSTYIAKLSRMVEGITIVANSLNLPIAQERLDLMEMLEAAELRYQRLIYGSIPRSAMKTCVIPNPAVLESEVTLC